MRKLDEELASGRLSADDYRVRRDQVLSSAVGQPDAQPAQQPGSADSTQVIAPISPPQGTPQPAPPQDNSAERTQAVPQWQQQQPAQPPEAARTEYVAPPQQQQVPYSPPGGFPQAGPVSPPGGFPQTPPPWNAPDSDQSPPWGGGDLPPLTPSGDPGWIQQGPESFDNKPKKGNGAKIGAIVAAVVVLAGIAFGAYMLWGRSSTSASGGGQTTTTQAAPSSQTPPDPMAVAQLPGTVENFDRIKSFSQIPALNYLTSNELSAYQTAGAGDTKFVARRLPDGSRVLMLLTTVSDPQAAQKAAGDLLAIQIRNGGTRVVDVPDGVLASSIDAKGGNPAQVRAHYAHQNVVVRIEVSNPNAQTAQTDFTSILNSQLKVLPANG
ncbi:hypothetical protein FNH06_10820 [Amycolatopsis acidiphila]|uniref:DUF1707 domain-containing protein n=1 Tax=Amycolatopsis acidiphila TaxID=715473 RepID=A0A558AFY3_9PSEU|nr:hypothetical protein FNH06_10820 [Amycolatopsis acidiphila]